MQMQGSRNLLLALLALAVALAALEGVSAGFDFFKKKDKAPDTTPAKGAEGSQQAASAADGEAEADVEMASPPAPSRARVGRRAGGESVRDTLNAFRANQGKAGAKRLDLEKVREAAGEQARIQSEVPSRPRYGRRGDKVQGRRRWSERREIEEAARRAQAEAVPADADDEEFDEEFDEESSVDGDEGSNDGENGGRSRELADRFSDKSVRDQANRKFVSTLPSGATGANDPRKPNLSFLKPSVVAKKTENGAGAISGEIKKNKLITSSYWSKQLGKAYKVTKNGIKGSAKIIAELPKSIERSVDSINAFLQLDSRGKMLALMDEAAGDARFVRKEFSQFTLSWSPVMEKALDYLGDTNLDKIKWNDKDELDHRKDALYSLAFGYEFMRLMIAWRESLLVAHEAFKLWLAAVKTEVEQKRLEVDESLVVQLRTTHTYMLLTIWSDIDVAVHEARTKLDYLMEVLDDRPKNYECEYFRNIVVLQEMYDPTVEEFDRERNQVASTISESGVVVDNLKDVDEFFTNFRNALAEQEYADIDWEVPKELTDFMAKLEPQLRRTSLIYPKAFLSELGLRK